jgi:hypothetical protein
MPPCIIMEKGEPLNVWSHRQMTYKTLAYVVRPCSHSPPPQRMACKAWSLEQRHSAAHMPAPL